MKCNYCEETDYHKCVKRDAAKVVAMANRITRVYGNGKPDMRPQTSQQLKEQADRRQDMARMAKQAGLNINPDYDLEIK